MGRNKVLNEMVKTSELKDMHRAVCLPGRIRFKTLAEAMLKRNTLARLQSLFYLTGIEEWYNSVLVIFGWNI